MSNQTILLLLAAFVSVAFTADSTQVSADAVGTKWVVVFRALSENGQSVYDAFTQSNPSKCEKTDCKGHYRHYALENWNFLGVTRVKLELFKDCQRAAYVVFNGTGSDLTSWFDRKRVLLSSWSDIKRIPGNYFSIAGVTTGVLRRLYINKSWGGCNNDIGWMSVLDGTGPCQWDKHGKYPVFLYSPTTSFTNFKEVDKADVLKISVEAPGLCK